MKLFRVAALSVAVLGGTAFASAQQVAWGYSGVPHQDNVDRHIYREGYEQGRSDADSRRSFHPDADRYREDDDRRMYREGYQAGYRAAQRWEDRDFDRDRDRDHDRDAYRYQDRDHDRDAYHDRDRDHDRDADHNRDGNIDSYQRADYGSMSRIAQENGYRDGMNDGQKDRATGHSFRPTHDDNYKNAPGYSSSMGDRQQYKNMYRQAYEQGYPLGYNGRR
jgi:hypothetical protein